MIDNATDNAFLALHVPGTPLLMPNPWDIGTARLLESLGFRALATTSGGHAASLGRLDGQVTPDEALAHAGALAAAVSVPVSADLEDGFGPTPGGVADTARAAATAGLAGFSIEDWSGEQMYDVAHAAERVTAASEAAPGLVLTARAENYFRQRDPDLAEVIARLQAYQEAGADVLYAPGLTDLADIGRLVAEVDRPVNVLAVPGLRSVDDLAAAGVARVSVGGAFCYLAVGALARAGAELLGGGLGFLDRVPEGRTAVQRAFGPDPTT